MGRRAPGPHDRIEVGRVARAHGIRGELRVVPHDPGSGALAGAEALWIGGRCFDVARARPTRGAYLIALEGVEDRDAASALRGEPVEVERRALDLGEEDVLLVDLVGCDAVLPDGTRYGTVEDIDAGTPQSRLVVREGDIERLVPVVDEFVREVDLDAGRVVLDPPEDLPETRRG